MTRVRAPWTSDEIATLRRLWRPAINADPAKLDWAAVERIGKRIGRPVGAVYQRARDLGLLGERKSRGHAGAGALKSVARLRVLTPEHRNGLISAAAAGTDASRVPPLVDFRGER